MLSRLFRSNPVEDVPTDAAAQIDRALDRRTRRLMIGLHVPPTFDRVDGAMVVVQGHGKFMRPIFAAGTHESISDFQRDECLALVESSSPSLHDAVVCRLGLADIQSVVAARLKPEAGKFVDRILGVGVTDPGIWTCDGFDDTRRYSSLCQTDRLAAITGLSVIDSFPAQDVEAGGAGYPLGPLPSWLLLADRSRRVATRAAVSVSLGESVRGYLLPPSDGLDATVPDIMPFDTPGIEWFQELSSLERQRSSSTLDPARFLGGVADAELIGQWNKLPTGKTMDQEFVISSVAVAAKRLRAGASLPDVLCSAMKFTIDHVIAAVDDGLAVLAQQWDREAARLQSESASQMRTPIIKLSTARHVPWSNVDERLKPDFAHVGNVMVNGPDAVMPVLMSQLINRLKDRGLADDSTRFGTVDGFISSSASSTPSLAAIESALMGLMHVDQMAGNLPDLTGASKQRILGRLTPGHPHSWRHLLCEMADFQPTAMKLRDAI